MNKEFKEVVKDVLNAYDKLSAGALTKDLKNSSEKKHLKKKLRNT